MKSHYSIFLLLLLLVAGCAGTISGPTGDLAGIVQDKDGNFVWGARVFVDDGPVTTSDTHGAYVLHNVQGNLRTVKATIRQDGVDYYGENVVQILGNERAKSTNITVIRANQRVTLSGTVRDRFGNLVEGAHVFALGGELSSTVVQTDRDGRFSITTLLASQNYTVYASALGYNSDVEVVNIPAGNSQDDDFTIGSAVDTIVTPPNDLYAEAWTSPLESTRSTHNSAGIEAAKKLIDPKYKSKTATRVIGSGSNIQVDLYWTQIQNTSLLGYGIYRGFGNTSSLSNVDFWRDPLALYYADADNTFFPGDTYTYGISTINTSYYPGHGESGLSNLATVSTLGELGLDAVSYGPLTFHWFAAAGATSYTVYVFDTFPGVGANIIWTQSTTGTSLGYTAPPTLVSGKTYYYVVLGLANTGTSKSISVVDTFVAP